MAKISEPAVETLHTTSLRENDRAYPNSIEAGTFWLDKNSEGRIYVRSIQLFKKIASEADLIRVV
ncbi:MAG: hypothetical protein MJA27_35755 [Pseudanabaenales cyanobacterium]|nr:hypothetical protein [Pseudanabaenales cyanobacterium]